MRELPEHIRGTPYPNLDRALRIEHPIQHCQSEWPPVMKLRSVVGAHSVAMRIDVHQAKGGILSERLQNRVGDRMIAAHREGPHALRFERGVIALDILERLLKAVATSKRYVTDIRRTRPTFRHAAHGRMVGADALDGAHGARPESRARAIGYAQIHRHADNRDIQIGGGGRMRQSEKSGNPGIGQRTLAIRRLHVPCGASQHGIIPIEHVAVGIACAQALQLFLIHGKCSRRGRI